MDFIDQLQTLSAKIPKLRDRLITEEATKNALVMPFIGMLGYDIFDPTEVMPEFIADVGIKKGEKVDYAVAKDDKIILLFECKKCGTDLDQVHSSQLYRYFSVTDARVGILTDGIVYRFFTDLDAPNKMDAKPYLEFNLLDIQEAVVVEVKKLSKPTFNLDDIITAAGEMKYMREIKRILADQLSSPSDEFVRIFAAQLHSGVLTQKARERFADITRRGFHQFINDRISERLKSALSGTGSVSVDMPNEEPAGQSEPTREGLIVTLPDETEAFHIVKAIAREAVAANRIFARDTQSYFGILLDDNNRKPICRLHFNRPQKYLGLFGDSRAEERIPIESIDDIYKYASQLKAAVAYYEKPGSSKSPESGEKTD